MNLDTLVRIGQPPWHPVPTAEDVDVWDKYEFPICGSYRLNGRLVVFSLITTAGSRSLWAYVPVTHEAEQAVSEAGFEAEAEFDDFVAGCFTGREAVFAAAENFVITSKSDGIPIPAGKNALLVMGQCRLDYFSRQPHKRIRVTAAPVATGMARAGIAGSGTNIPPRRGIPNFGGKPARFTAVCPTKIRYTLPSSSGDQDQLKLNGIVSWVQSGTRSGVPPFTPNCESDWIRQQATPPIPKSY